MLDVETEPESESVDGVDGRDVSMKAGLLVEVVLEFDIVFWLVECLPVRILGNCERCEAFPL